MSLFSACRYEAKANARTELGLERQRAGAQLPSVWRACEARTSRLCGDEQNGSSEQADQPASK